MTVTHMRCACRLAPLLAPTIVMLAIGCQDETAPRTASEPERALDGTQAQTLASGQLGSAAFHTYAVVTLGTLGGTASGTGEINDGGLITGTSNLPGDRRIHAVLWRNGRIVNLGTLGGPNSSSHGIDDIGLISGNSQTSRIDRFTEDFCGYGPKHVCVGFLWRRGTMIPLPRLGGTNGQAFKSNSLGQVVGFAETRVRDPNCVPPQVFRFRAVIWGPHRDEIRELPPLEGDAVSAALAINERAEVVGGSGICRSPDFSISVHPVLWKNNRAINLGGFGGTANNFGAAINDRGEVVGGSDLPGDATGHAFLWRDGTMIDLGTLPGDVFSVADDINNAGQVVGASCDADFNCRAFLWQDGRMEDLNTLISPHSRLSLIEAAGITAGGKIAGEAFDPRTSETQAFVAFPGSTASASELTASAADKASTRVVLPAEVRSRLKARRIFGHSMLAQP